MDAGPLQNTIHTPIHNSGQFSIVNPSGKFGGNQRSPKKPTHTAPQTPKLRSDPGDHGGVSQQHCPYTILSNLYYKICAIAQKENKSCKGNITTLQGFKFWTLAF